MLCLKWGSKLMLLNELASCFDILHEICIQLMLRSIWSFMRSSLFKTYSISIVLQSVWWEALVYQRIDPINQLRHNDKQPKSDTRNYTTGKCDFTISRTELSHVKSLILKTGLHHGVHVQQRICETLEIAQSLRKILLWAVSFSNQHANCKWWLTWPVPHVEDNQHRWPSI